MEEMFFKQNLVFLKCYQCSNADEHRSNDGSDNAVMKRFGDRKKEVVSLAVFRIILRMNDKREIRNKIFAIRFRIVQLFRGDILTRFRSFFKFD